MEERFVQLNYRSAGKLTFWETQPASRLHQHQLLEEHGVAVAQLEPVDGQTVVCDPLLPLLQLSVGFPLVGIRDQEGGVSVFRPPLGLIGQAVETLHRLIDVDFPHARVRHEQPDPRVDGLGVLQLRERKQPFLNLCHGDSHSRILAGVAFGTKKRVDDPIRIPLRERRCQRPRVSDVLTPHVELNVFLSRNPIRAGVVDIKVVGELLDLLLGSRSFRRVDIALGDPCGSCEQHESQNDRNHPLAGEAQLVGLTEEVDSEDKHRNGEEHECDTPANHDERKDDERNSTHRS